MEVDYGMSPAAKLHRGLLRLEITMGRASKHMLMAMLFCAACTGESRSRGALPMPPEVADVRLRMSKDEVLTARPKAREDPYGITESISPTTETTYLFPDHVQSHIRSGTDGLLAIMVDYRISDSDTVTHDSIIAFLETEWRALHGFRNPPVHRNVRKYLSSPALSTSASVWRVPEATLVLYQEFESPRNSAKYRLIRVILQEPSIPAMALLPREYRSQCRGSGWRFLVSTFGILGGRKRLHERAIRSPPVSQQFPRFSHEEHGGERAHSRTEGPLVGVVATARYSRLLFTLGSAS